MPEESLAIDANGAKNKDAIAREKEALETALTAGAWPEYAAYLQKSLLAFLDKDLKPGSTAAVEKLAAAPAAALALQRTAFLQAIGSKGQAVLQKSDYQDMARWILTTPRVMECVSTTLLPQDKVEGFFEVWRDIWQEDTAMASDKYMELAVAVALVFDSGFSPNWNGERLKLDPFERYMWYQKNNESGKLTGKVHDMRAADLVWVVCAPVPEKELDWALKKMKLPQKGWGASYGMVKYLMERAVKGLNPYKEYTLAEILKEGGICGDQAYFATNTARAHGIPAAVVSGDGDRGPHAWATWLADEGEWKFTGRFGGYPAGNTGNPQTGRGYSEEEFARMSERKAETGPRIIRARQLLWLANICAAEPATAGDLIESAVQAASQWPPAWRARLDHWRKNRATDSVEVWRKMVADAKKEFKENEDMLDLVRDAEEECIFPRQDPAVTKADLKRDVRKAATDSRKRDNDAVEADPAAIAALFKRQAELLKKTSDYAGMKSVYSKAFAAHGENPSLFKTLASDYYSFVKDDPEAAQDATREMERAARRYVTMQGTEYFTVQCQNSAWSLIADFYEKSGVHDRAEKIRKEVEKRGKAAAKRAI